MPSWMTTPLPTATSTAADPQALPFAARSTPWSCDHALVGIAWAGFWNGKTNPDARAGAGLGGRTARTRAPPSGAGASPDAPSNRTPNWNEEWEPRPRRAPPDRFAVSQCDARHG